MNAEDTRSAGSSQKRIRCSQEDDRGSDDDDLLASQGEDKSVRGENKIHHNSSKKPREMVNDDNSHENEKDTVNCNNTTSSSIVAEDSDSDYDDMIDEFAVPNDMEDYLDDNCEDEACDDDDDDHSTTSTRTTMSTGSVGSNTPSIVGENLESFCLGEDKSASSKGKNASLVIGGPVVKNTEPPLRRSLFSHVPPSINFVHHNEVPETPLPTELRKNLRWKLSNITPAVVKKVVTNSGYRLVRKTTCTTDWGGTWGKHMKSHMFKDSIGESQKINHLPGTFNIGRKDRLWKNYHKLRLKHGKAEFSFLPRTFCLPADTKLLRKVWEKRGVKAKWIVKPPAMARGTGIKVVNKWNQVPKCRPLIVQRYIARPHLINNTKYDLRIYVLMTSLHPLRIYLYDEGLVRFASNEYTRDNQSLGDVYMHLTNYSINKNSASYTHNDDAEVRQGHKWTLGSLWQHFAEHGIDQKLVWERIKDLVIKTIISAEHAISPLIRNNVRSRYSGYELFGFDVLLDADLKPWLIEVNISPSLHSASPLDLDVKSPLATEVFNIVRYHVPNKISPKAQRQILQKLNMDDVSVLCLDPRLYTRDLSKADKAKQNRIVDLVNIAIDPASARLLYLEPILEKLTPDDVRCLIRGEDEMAQLTHFSRIFPTQDTHKYFKYFSQPRYYNLLLDAWEQKYGDCRSAGIDRLERLCLEKVHLKIPQTSSISSTTSSGSTSHITSLSSSSCSSPQIYDVSMLKGPTGDGIIRKPEPKAKFDAYEGKQVPSCEASRCASTTKTNCWSQDGPMRPTVGITIGNVLSKQGSKCSSEGSPEPMSTGGDSMENSECETKSRSPSPCNKTTTTDATTRSATDNTTCSLEANNHINELSCSQTQLDNQTSLEKMK